MKKVRLCLWILACVAALLVSFSKYDGTAQNDIGIFLVWAMLALTFPIGILVAAIFAALVVVQEEFGVRTVDWIQSSYVGFAVLWLTFVAAGYWQWFYFVPVLWSRWRKSTRTSGA